MSAGRVWTEATLPFERLEAPSFERFCFALLAAEGHTKIRHWGAAGSEKGCDLVSLHPDGRPVVTQCKRVKKLGPKDAETEVRKVLDTPPSPPPKLWSLVATCNLSRETEERVDAAVGGAFETAYCGLTELDLRTRAHPDLVEWFFGPSLGAQVAPPLWWVSAAPGDRQWAEAFADDLRSCLRQVRPDADVEVGIPSNETPWPEVPARARWGLVVVTPEALADSRLRQIWRGSLCGPCQSGGERRLAALALEPAPWPPWLKERFHLFDLGEDGACYHIDLSAVLSKYIGWTEKNQLPELRGPGERRASLPAPLRQRLVSWMEPLMTSRTQRGYLAVALGLEGRKALEAFETPADRASAALVLASTGDDPVAGALRAVGVLKEEAEDQSAARLEALEALDGELRQLRAQLPERRDLLTAWLEKVAADHRRLVPHFQQKHELDLLDRVYVELQMAASHREMALPEEAPEGSLSGRAGQEDLSRTGRGSTLQELLTLDPEKHPWVSRRWVVRGDPGSGKTTLLRHLAAKLAREQTQAQAGAQLVPLFQSLPALIRDGRTLLERAERSLAAAGREGLSKVLDRLGEEGRLLVLLDGLDEVSPEDREEAESRIRQMALDWPKSHLVVTTRPIGYRRFAGEFQEVQLLPLERPQRREFLARWFGRLDGSEDLSRADAALRELDDPAFEELAGNPLYLTLMAMLIEDPDSPSPSSNRAELYKQVFQLLLDGKHKLSSQDRAFEPIARPELVRRTLRKLAESMTLDNRDAEPRGQLEERLYSDELAAELKEMRKVRRWDGRASQFLDDVAEKVGILGDHDGEGTDWRFWHRTFREALVAEQMAQWPEDRILEQAKKVKGQESRWAEPFALLSAQVEDADALLRLLLEANRPLALRALATAQSVSDEVVEEILELTGDQEKRSKVFESLPEKIGDPDRCLRLIDRLRKQTRNGNDLYFLDRAAFLVGAVSEDFAADARKLRAKLYDHIPPVNPDLLRHWQDPDGESHDLWLPIPEGIGWIGKRDDEEGQEWESPRHRVEIKKPFWLAAIPITNRLYATFDPTKPPSPWKGVGPKELAHHPRSEITWYEAVSFCRWLGLQRGFEGTAPRLPEEEVWEYACRADTETRFSTGEKDSDLESAGWYSENSGQRTHHVGGKALNRFSLFDLHGNVWEWTATEFDAERYKGRSAEEPHPVHPAALPADLAGSPRVTRVMRGGSYGNSALWCRSAFRSFWDPWDEFRDQGFRVLLSSAPSPAVDL